MSWTEEKVAKLKELWSKGHTASQIAEALGDTTRNAVIGKAHRLNLEARAPSKQSNSPRTNDNKQIRRGPAPTSAPWNIIFTGYIFKLVNSIPVKTKKVLNHLRYFLINSIYA